MVPGVAACTAMPGNTRYSLQKAPGAESAFGSCTRRSKKEPPTVTVFFNGKKLARSCVCSSGRVGFPRRASAAHGTVLGLPATSIVLILRVGDVHDGHQSLLGAEAALQPVTVYLGDDLQDIPLVETQLSCLGGNVMAKSFHFTAGRGRGGRVNLPQHTHPIEAQGPPQAQRCEESTPCLPPQTGSQLPPSSLSPADCRLGVDRCTSCVTALICPLVHEYKGGQVNCNSQSHANPNPPCPSICRTAIWCHSPGRVGRQPPGWPCLGGHFRWLWLGRLQLRGCFLPHACPDHLGHQLEHGLVQAQPAGGQPARR